MFLFVCLIGFVVLFDGVMDNWWGKKLFWWGEIMFLVGVFFFII